MSHTRQITALTALALTAACGGGGGSTGPEPTPISADEELTRTFATETGDLSRVSTALTSGETLTARSVGTVSQLRDFTNNISAPAESTMALSINPDGELTVSGDHDGTPYEVAFAPADRQDNDGYIYYETDGEWGGFFSGSLDEVLDPGSDRVAHVFELLDTHATFGIIGVETQDAALAGLSTATYGGRTYLKIHPDDFPGGDWTRIRSDVTLNADFAAGEISGLMSNFDLEPSDSDTSSPIDGTMTMETAVFDVNAYTGTLTPDDDLQSALGLTIDDTVYSGAFYGTEAQSTGGTFRVLGNQDSGGGFNGHGYFLADQ